MDTQEETRTAWIRQALTEKPDKTQKGLAEALGLDPSQGHRIANGKRPLRAAEIPLIERYLGVRSELAPNQSEREAFTVRHRERPISAAGDRRYDYGGENFVQVPVYDVRAAAGDGAVAFDAAPIYFQMFRESELRAMTHAVTQLFVLEIDGDSALPTLHGGDRALCDRSQVNPRHDGLYVIRVDDVLQVKRLSMHPVSRRLTIKSENPDYPTYSDINPDEVAIVARVVWIGRRLA